jgi:hypothetical protein
MPLSNWVRLRVLPAGSAFIVGSQASALLAAKGISSCGPLKGVGELADMGLLSGMPQLAFKFGVHIAPL